MKSDFRSGIASYGLAIALAIIACAARYFAQPYLVDEMPFITFFPAIFVAAIFTRFWPTIVALVSSLAVVTVFIMPTSTFLLPSTTVDWLGLAMFTLFGIGMAQLGEVVYRRGQKVREERERFLVTLASVGDAMIATDDQGQITFLNAVAEQLTGWTLAEATGQPLENVFRIVNEQTRKVVENPVAKVLREGRIVGLANHTILLAKSGHETAIDDSAAPIRDQDGRIIGVVLVFRDVTQQRHVEVAQSRLAAIVDSSEDAILGQTFEGVITDWNAGSERLFGYTAAEAVGRSIFALIAPPDRKEELLAILKRIQQGERAEQFETIRHSRDGRIIPVSIRISPIENAKGEIIGASAIDRDISHLRAAERRRNARLAVTQILAHDTSPEQARAEAVSTICTALEWEVGCYWQLDPEQNVLRATEYWQDASLASNEFQEITLELAFERGSGIAGRIWQSGEPLWITNIANDPTFLRAPQAKALGLQSGFACPVGVGGQFSGVIEFFSRRLQQPDADLLETVATIAGQIGQFIERHEAQRKLRRSEQVLSDFFENAAIGLHWVGPDGTILRVNKAELEMLGYSREEYLGRNIAEFHVDSPVITNILTSLSAGEQLRDHEARLRCKDGSIRHVLVDSNVLWENGKFIHTRCFTRDITQRKHLEQSLRFLAEASRCLSSLVDLKSTLQVVANLAVPDFADWCTVDMIAEDGTVKRLAVSHVDAAKVSVVENLFQQYPPKATLPRGPLHVLRTGQPEMVSLMTPEMLAEAAYNDEHLQILRDLDVKSYICVPIAVKEHLLGVMTFVFSTSGRRYGPDDFSMAKDLTHRAAIAIDNARLYQEVRDADRRKDEFLAMLAHELRNPLAPIRSGLDILSMDPGEHSETVSLMQEQVEHVVRLVDDLLDVSRIIRGKIELRREFVELADVVRRSVKAVRPMIENHQHQFQVVIPAEPIWLYADPVRLVQVIENLLNNASKYTDTGGRIELAVSTEGSQAVVEVRDSGLGIEPDLLPHVFELFTQASRSLDRAQGGLGIGLTLVQRLIEMHGGSVSAHSEGIGRGSTFRLQLPISDRQATAESVAIGPDTNVARRIVVVDDNVGAAKLLTSLLLKLGEHEISKAHDGPSALATVQAVRPELVLLDIGLPGMDGHEVARAIRSDRKFDDVLLVALTGYGQEEDRQKSQAAGFDLHLVKPPSVDQIREVLAHPKLATSSNES